MSRIDTILAGFTAQQRAAAIQDGPVIVLAGAGTGKTKTLTGAVAHRIEGRGIDPNRILAVTFTNKAAGEMTSRIQAALGSGAAPTWTGTFHGLGARQLRASPEVAGLRSGFDILDADDARRVLKRVMKGMNLSTDETGMDTGRDPLKMMAGRISRMKDDLITPEAAPALIEAKIGEAHRSGGIIDAPGLRATVKVYAEYQRMLGDANAADFGDLLLWPTHAMQVSTEYRARWEGRFDTVLADEYQDVNRVQYNWLRLLSGYGEIFCVGDDDQSIFGFRGADVSYIRRFAQDFPAAKRFKLEENFRSDGHILDAANAVIAQDR
ncbi:MAG: ATP-dependent helicase, partial [Alphaproteobacteria bacterium]